jgi:Putative Flp pilus-assembly TadE/G-like
MHLPRLAARSRRGQQGQILVVAALTILFAMVGGVSLVVEGGNAYVHQRVAQNAADSVANAGATVLAQELGGAIETDADVLAAMNRMSTANQLTTYTGYYTNVTGQPIDSAGVVAITPSAYVRVGGGAIPPGSQGVRVTGSQTFATTIAHAIGINQFTASADATSVTGALTGGLLLPLVLPINITDCSGNGNLGTGESNWVLSKPGPTNTSFPIGPEYIIPLCKTGGGSFQILDFDNSPNDCASDVANPPSIQFPIFPALVASDNGNNCAKPMVPAVNALHGKVVLVPICDTACVTGGGSNATYHIIKIAALWIDYMYDSNNANKIDAPCVNHIGASGQQLTTIAGNGSSSCIAGWFMRYVTSGPVGAGGITGSGAIGVQLIK